MRSLVTGATGFIGYEVARQLAAAEGVRSRLMVSRPERGRLLAQLDAELVLGDLTRPASLARAVAGVDTVIHLGARATFEDIATLRPTIVDGTAALVEAAAAAGVRSFVYASSLLVYGTSATPIGTGTPARPQLDYGRAKLEAEAAVAAVAARSGMQLAVLRLPHVYGARDLLFEQVRGGHLFLPGRGRNLYAHMHVADAARVLIETARQGWTGVAPVADALSTSWRDFVGIIRQHYTRFRVHWIPAWLALGATAAARAALSWRRQPSIMTPGSVIGFNLNLPVEPGLVWNDLGISPRFPTAHEGIPAALDECVAFRWRHPVFDRKGW
jgi:nucleoside-diphosphate-sugar epimerase